MNKVEELKIRKIGDLRFGNLQFGSKKAYIRPETENERLWREEKIRKWFTNYPYKGIM